ncbi:hypothetical protein [Streptomyces sp. Wh19]|uniref:hypothetical protein n=1 Tax=Streptomyces sp. Wh19 TaxID=3076629 RepID=UPI002958A996|nr:hypothetical protein [Streptomyces sp. Wh19]MDV9194308.1 hypothetical protein [Streptomyces sp. Wh19]
MPQHATTPSFLERLAVLEEQVATLRRTGWERDELPFYPTSMRAMPYDDATAFTSVWESVLAPRTASLSLGLVFIGDQVSGTNTGGAWQVVLNEADTVMSGSIAATFSYQFAAQVIDLTPYRTRTELKVQIQVRRTSGATTGGKFGGGGAIGMAPRYARLL